CRTASFLPDFPAINCARHRRGRFCATQTGRLNLMSKFAGRRSRSRRPGAWLLAALALLGATTAARAHPHVFVTTKTELRFGEGGKVVAIRHQWTFDDMYSAFVTEGLSAGDTLATKEQLAPLAKTNVEQLAQYDWFTVAKV